MERRQAGRAVRHLTPRLTGAQLLYAGPPAQEPRIAGADYVPQRERFHQCLRCGSPDAEWLMTSSSVACWCVFGVGRSCQALTVERALEGAADDDSGHSEPT
jgi:hypothetical protein